MADFEQLIAAGARLINAAAAALETYTRLEEKKAEYLANAASQAPQEAEKPFEEFTPGYFERKFGKTAG